MTLLYNSSVCLCRKMPAYDKSWKRKKNKVCQVAHHVGDDPGFRSTRLLGVLIFYSPLDGMLVHHRVTPSIKFAGTHLYTWVERGTVRVVSAKTSMQCPCPGPQPRTLDPKVRTLVDIMMPPCFPTIHVLI